MRKTRLILLFLLLILRGSTIAQNPYESLGKVAPVLTLSNGKYQEFMTNDTIVQIGSVLFNTITNEVVSFLDEDSLRLMEADLTTRFLSVDPIGKQYPELTPYQFASNTPIQAIDLDGLEGFHHFNDEKNKFIGFELVIKILNETGIAGEILKSFAASNNKTDMYYHVENLSTQGGLKGHTEVHSGYKSIDEKILEGKTNEYKQKIQKGNYQSISDQNSSISTDDLKFIWKITLAEGKGVIFIQLSEELIKKAGTSLEALAEITLTAVHEPIAHGLNSKTGINLQDDLSEHCDFNGKESQMAVEAANPKQGSSPAYKDIDPKSPAGKYKARIEAYIKANKVDLEKMMKEAKEKMKEAEKKEPQKQ